VDDDGKMLKEIDREVYRTALVSLFWSIIQDRKAQPGGYRMQDLARELGIDKSQVSRWFSDMPNWEANTVADIANALDVELRVEAYDRTTGKRYTSVGPDPEPLHGKGRAALAGR